MYGPGTTTVPASNWSLYPAISTISAGNNVITTSAAVNAGSFNTTGAISSASVLTKGAISGASVTATGAINGASMTATGAILGASLESLGTVTTRAITTSGLTSLNLGTGGLSNSIQVSATGNVGIRKAPNVALDIEGTVNAAAISISGNASLNGESYTHNISPATTNTYNNGDPSYRWANTYTQQLDVLTKMSIGGATPLCTLYNSETGTSYWKGMSYFGNNVKGIVLGTYGGVPQVGAHSAALDAWENLVLCGGGKVGIGMTPSGYQLELSLDSAAKPTKNTWDISSDVRIKKNIEDADLNLCYQNFKSLRLRRFEWDPEYYDSNVCQDRHCLGFIAQEVKDLFPKAVTVQAEKGFYRYPLDSEAGPFRVLNDFHTLNTDQIDKSHIGATRLPINKVEALEAQLSTLQGQS